MCARRRVRKQISILIPFGGEDPGRIETLEWVLKYWRAQLPDAEIVVGHDRASERRWHRRKPAVFSKACAVNDAFRRSHGDVIAIMDADAYLDATVLTHCAERLRAQRKAGVQSWFVPYDALYRLNRIITKKILESDPKHPLRLPTPPPPYDIEGRDGSGPLNIFGAMCQVMPREAFITVGGMDPRYRFWGHEDSSFLHALNTLWGEYKSTPNQILHLWHPRILAGDGAMWTVRMWPGQESPHMGYELAARYQRAAGNPDDMRALVDEVKRRI